MTPPSAQPVEVQISTSEYKIGPLKKAARELLGYPHPRRVPPEVYIEQTIGISTDLCRRFVTCPLSGRSWMPPRGPPSRC